jgi:hypothetical protein
MISWFGPQNQGQLFVSSLALKPLRRFLGLSLKTKVDGLVIWASKSPRRFLDLCLKIMLEEVCRFVSQNRWADEYGVRTCIDIWQLLWCEASWDRVF